MAFITWGHGPGPAGPGWPAWRPLDCAPDWLACDGSGGGPRRCGERPSSRRATRGARWASWWDASWDPGSGRCTKRPSRYWYAPDTGWSSLADQTCCGALAAHDGAADGARRLADRNMEAFGGVDYIVADAAGCSAHLKDYPHWVSSGAPGRMEGQGRQRNGRPGHRGGSPPPADRNQGHGGSSTPLPSSQRSADHRPAQGDLGRRRVRGLRCGSDVLRSGRLLLYSPP